MSDLNIDATHPEASSVILPPPAIRSIVEKTAAYVAKSPNAAQFEEKIRAREKSDSRFAFLNADDAYHPYYQQRLEAFREGEAATAPTGDTPGLTGEKAPVGTVPATVVADTNKDGDRMPPKPPALEFLVEQPPAINAVDLDILKLTALFTARSGRRFTSELASRESRNYQFDFLRPTHSLFGYFNQFVQGRLVEQYTKILMPSDEFRNGLRRRSLGTLDSNHHRVTTSRREVLSDSQLRVDWQAWDMSRRRELEDAQEAERVAFAEIDWQDFVVASTIDFTEADEAALTELPPPMSLSEVENMTIAQKKMAAMIMEGKTVGQDDIDNDDETEAMDMRGDDDDDQTHVRDQTTHQPTTVPSPIVEIRAADTSAPMKIRKDYVPKANRPAAPSQAFTTFNNQQIPVEEFASHVRIELLDPKWKEDKRQSEVNRSTANLLPQGTDVSSSIRDLAAHRPDIFGAGADDEARRKQEQAEALARSKKRELGVWDGHTTTKDAITSRYQAGANLDEQIEALHRAKGLVGSQNDTAPVIGPTVPNLSNVDVTSASIKNPTLSSVMSSVLPAADQPTLVDTNPRSTETASSPVPNSLPTAVLMPAASIETPGAAGPSQIFDPLSSSSFGVPAGVPTNPNRLADASPDEEPIAKRARVSAPGNGDLRSEAEWLKVHGTDPIKIQIQLPEYPAKPTWGCDGSSFSLEVPLTLLVGTIRDRITSKVGLPVSKQKLLHNGRILANSSTLAALNFEEGDQIHVAIKEKK